MCVEAMAGGSPSPVCRECGVVEVACVRGGQVSVPCCHYRWGAGGAWDRIPARGSTDSTHL